MAKRKYHKVSDQHVSAPGNKDGRTEEPLLSPQRAFVVQFREGIDATPQFFSGRVEHLVSGRATRFRSPEELLAFLAEILATLRCKPP